MRYRILVLLFLTWGQLALGQVNTYKLYNISSEDGLISDYLEFIYQDSYGFCWIANFEGLTRWDGHTFKKYQHSEKDSHSLSQNIVYCVFEDHQRRLWVGTIGGLEMYDRERDQFVHIKLQSNTDRIPVNAIAEDSKHQLWLGTSNGLCRYDHDQQRQQWYKGEPYKFTDFVIFALTIDRHDHLWLGTYYGGVNEFIPATGEVRSYMHKEDDPQTVCSNKIKSIYADDDDNIWVGSYDRGITLLNNQGKVIQQYFISKDQATHSMIYRIYQDRNKNIWVGAGNEMLHYLDRQQNRFVPFTNLPYKKNLSVCRSISSMCEDSFGNLWFASAGNGLFYTNTNKNFFHSYHKKLEQNPGLNNEMVTCFHEDRSGLIWIGTNGGGISIFDPRARTFSSLTTSNGLSSNSVHDIIEDPSGNLWVSTWSGGIMSIDPKTRRVQKFVNDVKDENSLIYNNIKSIVFAEGKLWIGTHGEGIAVFDPATKTFIHRLNNRQYPFNMNNPAWVNHMFRDTKGRIWMGAYGGLYVYDGKSMKHFQHDQTPGSLAHNDVNMIAETKRGQIWIALESGGLDLYDEKTGTFIHYSDKYQLPMLIKSLVEDKYGVLWLGTNEGIIAFNPITKEKKKYDAVDGLQGNFFFLKAARKMRNDDLYFGGTNGFTYFNPDSIRGNTAPSNFYFTDLYIFDQLQRPGAEGSPISKVLSYTPELILQADQSFFTIGFTDINLYAPQKTQYAYKLEGLYDQWINIQSERKVAFTSLAPGTYTLRVKYSTLSGQWREADQKLRIIILPPWWKTWWFKTLVVLLILVIIVLFFYYRLRAINRRNRQLEEEVRKRTFELTEANSYLIERQEEIKSQKEKLEVSNEEIVRQSEKILVQQQRIIEQNQALEKTVGELAAMNNTKDRFFSILAHDLKNPVAAMKGIADLYVKNLEQLKKEDLLEFIGIIHKSSNAVFSLVHGLLDWSRTQTTDIPYKPTDVNVLTLVNKNVLLMEQQYRAKQINVTVDVDPALHVYADENMMDTVVRNLISNSIKFTNIDGQVNIGAEASTEFIRLSVADNGVGMSPEILSNLFAINQQRLSKGTAGEQGTGLGLMIVKEFVEANKGTMDIKSKEGTGSVFTVSIPKSSVIHSKDATAGIAEALPDTLALSAEKLKLMKGKRVLIVEDQQDVRSHLRMLLSSTFEIFEAEDGEQGLKAAEAHQPSLIITDLLMPVMGGLEFSRRIKSDAHTSHIPVILLTSQDSEDMKLSGYEAGVDVYLTKPARQDILFQLILNLIRKQEVTHQQLNSSDEIYPDHLPINKLDEEFLNKVTRLIEDNISNQEMDYQLLCEHTAMSRTVLYAKFKAITGQGVHEFIRTLRLKKSIQLLMQEKLTVNEIAYEVGFNSPSYYIRSFNRQYGCSPKEYVKSKKQS